MLKGLYFKYGDNFNWFTPPNMKAFEKELTKELICTHPLYGIKLDAIAKNDRNDDIVHLTWSSGTSQYPLYKIFTGEEILLYLEQDYLSESL